MAIWQFYIYLIVLYISFTLSMYRLSFKDKTAISIFFLVFIVLETEPIAYTSARLYHSNHLIYSLSCPAQFACIMWYFNNSIHKLRKYNLGVILAGAIVGTFVIVAIILRLSYQSFYQYFIIVEGITVIAVAMFSFYYMLSNENIQLFRSVHFWITTLLFIYWCITYLYWGTCNALFQLYPSFYKYLFICIWVATCILYIGLGLVLYFQKRGKFVH